MQTVFYESYDKKNLMKIKQIQILKVFCVTYLYSELCANSGIYFNKGDSSIIGIVIAFYALCCKLAVSI
jgi:hypothetical protein